MVLSSAAALVTSRIALFFADGKSMANAEAVAGAQTFHRTINLLRLISSHGDRGLPLLEIIRRSGLTRPTVHRMIQALEQEGFVFQDKSTGFYQLGPELFLMGLASAEYNSLRHEIQTTLADLVRASEDTALFTVRRGDHAIFVAREEGTYPVRTYIAGVGTRRPLGVGAASMAILATLDNAEIDEVLARTAEERRLEHSGFTADIHQLVAETRQQGYAINPGWEFSESWAIALPVLDQYGRCHGSMTLAGVRSRIDPRRDEIVEILSAATARFARHYVSRYEASWARATN